MSVTGSGIDGNAERAGTRRTRPWLAALLPVVAVMAGCGEDDGGAHSGAARAGTAAAPAAAAHVPAGRDAAVKVERWYGPEQVERGAVTYAASCASCHGDGAQGTFDWRRKGPDGRFPPPPLDGTAHAWHHPVRALASQIKFGAPGGQGNMPGFATTLSDEQVLEVIAWIQSRWPDDVYAAWRDIEVRSRAAVK